MKKVIEMKHAKSTPGTHVYGCIEENTPVPTLYIKKGALPDSPPETVTVTLEWDE